MKNYELVQLGEQEYKHDISISDTLLFDIKDSRMNFKIKSGTWTSNGVRNKKTKEFSDVVLFHKGHGSNTFMSAKDLNVDSTSGFLLLAETIKHKDTLKNSLIYTECLDTDYSVKVLNNKIAIKVKPEEDYPIYCSSFAGLITGIKIKLIDY